MRKLLGHFEDSSEEHSDSPSLESRFSFNHKSHYSNFNRHFPVNNVHHHHIKDQHEHYSHGYKHDPHCHHDYHVHDSQAFGDGKSLLGNIFQIFRQHHNNQDNVVHLNIGPSKFEWFFNHHADSQNRIPNMNGNHLPDGEFNGVDQSDKNNVVTNFPTKKPAMTKLPVTTFPTSDPRMTTTTATSTQFPKIDIRSSI